MNNLMIDGITSIDEKLIESYFKEKERLLKKKTNRNHRIIRWDALVACLAIVLIGTIVFRYILFEPTKFQYGYSKDYSLFYKGEQSMSEYGTIEYLDADDCSITIIFEKTTDDYVYATLFGYNDSVSSQISDVYCGTTLSKVQGKNVQLVNDGIQIYVDDKLMSEFPRAPGRYTIRIIYDKLKNICDRLDVGIYIHGFDYFMINSLNIDGVDPSELIPNQRPSDLNGLVKKYLY